MLYITNTTGAIFWECKGLLQKTRAKRGIRLSRDQANMVIPRGDRQNRRLHRHFVNKIRKCQCNLHSARRQRSFWRFQIRRFHWDFANKIGESRWNLASPLHWKALKMKPLLLRCARHARTHARTELRSDTNSRGTYAPIYKNDD